MESSSVAEQRATAVAKLKRAASLPRMKDGRRPPMHVEAVSEGERTDRMEQGRSEETNDKKEENTADPKVNSDRAASEEPAGVQDGPSSVTATPTPAETTTARKRRSRSRSRSRGSKDLRGKKILTLGSNGFTESSADESYAPGTADEVPPSPPLVSPIPSHFASLATSRLLMSPMPPLFYPGTSPSTPMLPSLDDIQRGIGLFRSNSAGAARAMAMHKLTGGKEMGDLLPSSPTPPLPGVRLARNNTVSGGERMVARKLMLTRLGERVREADGDQTSGGEEAPTPISQKRRRRRSKRASSRASTVVDDREDREPSSTTPNTPIVPPSPLPSLFHKAPDPPRPPSATRRAPNGRDTGSLKLNGDTGLVYENSMGRRGVVVEEEDDMPEQLSLPRPPFHNLPSTPARGYGQGRVPHSSDAPSNASTDSAATSAIGVPVFLSEKSMYKPDIFPTSPFATPLKEKPYGDEEEDQEMYQDFSSRLRTGTAYRESTISWVAEPVPDASRMPVHVEDEDDGYEEDEGEHGLELDGEGELDADETDELPTEPSSHPTSARPLPDFKDPIIETSPETTPAPMPPSPPATHLSIIVPREPSQPSTPTYPMRLSVATPNQLDHSPSGTVFEWDAIRADSTPKRAEGTSAWEKVKNTFSRSGSSTGRRSRTNSVSARDRRNNTDSSVSRESGASLKIEKTDSSGAGPLTLPQTQQLMQSPSASTSILSLAPHVAPPGGVSPVPPVSTADLMKYADSKLFPFPGMKQLEEQMNRNRAISASSPDIALSSNGGFEMAHSSSSSSTATKSPEANRERKLSHMGSDTRLLAKFSGSPAMGNPFSAGSQVGYFDLQPANPIPASTSSSLKLPMNREGVKKWLKLFSPQSPSVPSTPSMPTVSPVVDSRPRIVKKTSLSDLLLGRKEADLTADWEDVTSSDKSRTPTTGAHTERFLHNDDNKPTAGIPFTNGFSTHDSTPETPQSPTIALDKSVPVEHPSYASPDYLTAFPSPPEHLSSATPDPQSSLDDFPTRSTSESFSTMSSSQHSPDPRSNTASHSAIHNPGAIIMERLDEILGRGSKSSLWPTVIDDPPRKLVLSSPVLQVANANTVKDRFLFLFNDILVIAKPIVQESETLLDTTKPTPLDRKFIVKSIARLSELRLNADRDDPRTKTSSSSNPMRHPVIRSFVHQFTKDPDHAIAVLFDKTSCGDDPIALGQLMFRTVDLDRARLGDYLSQRTSKVVLRAFIDGFGFAGLRIDKALRVFLQAIHIPTKSSSYPSPVEYLLDAFAARWYEANAGIVAYDRDLAVRLARAIVQLNEVMHGGIAQEPGITGYPKRNVKNEDFVDAFRRFDSRGLVSDDLLRKIYASVRHERLSQARNPAVQTGHPEVAITIKRPIPPRLTYRMQSDPIILRIPQPDTQLTIQLFGQDLIFEPPVLSFAKSAEVSFRVTGTSLGPKSIIMWRAGPNALAYSGLPLSSPVVVERAFMRNTFQVAFLNHHGTKRKYMFSVDDPLIRHQWAVSLKRQIDIVAAARTREGTSKGQCAAQGLAFRVLQETLISVDEDGHTMFPSAVDHALFRLNGNGKRRSAHARSKSRSQVYHNGAGKAELELSSADTEGSEAMTTRIEGRLWNGRDLEVLCRQNSSIGAVLDYLHVGASDGGGDALGGS